MTNACFDKGASIYAGWKGGIRDEFGYRAGMFLFDRLLAANHYVPEAPKQRPFDFGSIYVDMRQRNYDTDLGDGLSKAEAPPEWRAIMESKSLIDPSPASSFKRGEDTVVLAI